MRECGRTLRLSCSITSVAGLTDGEQNVVGISENRLSKANIACSNSEDILVAGKVTEAIFDKTGKSSCSY